MTTKQEIFDRVYLHAKSMNNPAMDPLKKSCKYRSESGPCLIGSLISDDAYSPSFEGESANSKGVIEALIESGLTDAKDHTDFLGNLQSKHDAYVNSPNFKELMMDSLWAFSIESGLTIPTGESK